MECFLDKYKINSLDELYSYKIKNIGRYANKVKNPIMYSKDIDIYVMYCENNCEIMLDKNQ